MLGIRVHPIGFATQMFAKRTTRLLVTDCIDTNAVCRAARRLMISTIKRG
jgi:hypothetical protein